MILAALPLIEFSRMPALAGIGLYLFLAEGLSGLAPDVPEALRQAQGKLNVKMLIC